MTRNHVLAHDPQAGDAVRLNDPQARVVLQMRAVGLSLPGTVRRDLPADAMVEGSDPPRADWSVLTLHGTGKLGADTGPGHSEHASTCRGEHPSRLSSQSLPSAITTRLAAASVQRDHGADAGDGRLLSPNTEQAQAPGAA